MISNSDNSLASEFPNALTRVQFYWKRSKSGTAAQSFGRFSVIHDRGRLCNVAAIKARLMGGGSPG
jgi:hypothetical protein